MPSELSDKTVEDLLSEFGKQATAKLDNPSVQGSPEDQLRGPLEALWKGLANLRPVQIAEPVFVGETHLSELHTRPDYAVTQGGALIGYIEVKAPGKGINPRDFKDKHDKSQWNKLKSLPNLLYTDGNGFSLYLSLIHI